MKWVKWLFLALAIILAIIVLCVKPQSDSRIGTLFGYYFQVIFAFTLLSGGIHIFYSSLVFERVVCNYSDKFAHITYLKLCKFVLTTPFDKFVAMTAGDEKLHRWVKREIFWLYCALSIIITAPLGAVVFFILGK